LKLFELIQVSPRQERSRPTPSLYGASSGLTLLYQSRLSSFLPVMIETTRRCRQCPNKSLKYDRFNDRYSGYSIDSTSKYRNRVSGVRQSNVKGFASFSLQKKPISVLRTSLESNSKLINCPDLLKRRIEMPSVLIAAASNFPAQINQICAYL
jgi:hypothetical protein